jgi:hypothetical protein
LKTVTGKTQQPLKSGHGQKSGKGRGDYLCCSASMKQISPSPSSKHSPQIKKAPGFAHAFCPQSGQVNFVLLDFFALACLSTGADCQWS